MWVTGEWCVLWSPSWGNSPWECWAEGLMPGWQQEQPCCLAACWGCGIPRAGGAAQAEKWTVGGLTLEGHGATAAQLNPGLRVGREDGGGRFSSIVDWKSSLACGDAEAVQGPPCISLGRGRIFTSAACWGRRWGGAGAASCPTQSLALGLQQHRATSGLSCCATCGAVTLEPGRNQSPWQWLVPLAVSPAVWTTS